MNELHHCCDNFTMPITTLLLLNIKYCRQLQNSLLFCYNYWKPCYLCFAEILSLHQVSDTSFLSRHFLVFSLIVSDSKKQSQVWWFSYLDSKRPDCSRNGRWNQAVFSGRPWIIVSCGCIVSWIDRWADHGALERRGQHMHCQTIGGGNEL